MDRYLRIIGIFQTGMLNSNGNNIILTLLHQLSRINEMITKCEQKTWTFKWKLT